ncbi:hypothetical protein M427DRAFT_111365 [Gonapodya prolifera JEL478]|uniref:Chromatin modification-related protein n=1 Tax=Gonapodya prolifera (strain JEL478) TaxID=1344416 RepID=A0A139AGX7_GONPJ|nr:hypothetical protein M427DRAFT_111365 [Gonapodya prolifera JEL478]|eukprot:KXS16082.1 hypothetical protein M427DRAFT_111365 [Gonapodya prolifera JEL478]
MASSKETLPQMIFLFDFLDAVESFPHSVASSFTAIREAEAAAKAVTDKTREEISQLVTSLPDLTPSQKIQHLQSLSAALEELRGHEERKMEVTVRAQSMSRRVVDRIEDVLDRYDEEEKMSRRQAHLATRQATVPMINRVEQEPKSTSYGRERRERPAVDYQQNSKRDEYLSPGTKRRRLENGKTNGGKLLDKQRKRIKQAQPLPDPEPLAYVESFEPDPDAGRLWCICQRPSFGEMVGCDNEECPIEWYHYECVGLSAPPEGAWYCDYCKAKFPKGRKTQRR